VPQTFRQRANAVAVNTGGGKGQPLLPPIFCALFFFEGRSRAPVLAFAALKPGTCVSQRDKPMERIDTAIEAYPDTAWTKAGQLASQRSNAAQSRSYDL
jgi:hypothetical protein